ncbi:hypothetical protein F7725_028367 [Dissostichus mawsoni]|uniref:Uncharacterized protein n=1 Tax=Dissostichus mawsoni TaxID=36200 RepID=A0A7J5XGS1_DISMA|nr:hypothetical protein F7725_028367 [Dissostichus mawsoni]
MFVSAGPGSAYERCPYYPTAATFILSAMWHGAYPRVYDVMTWAATQICICYMVVPFILLSVGPSLKFYRSVNNNKLLQG